MISESDVQARAGRTLFDFVTALRSVGLRPDLNSMHALFASLAALPALDLRALHQCGRLTLCASEDEVRRYDQCFAEFFCNASPGSGELLGDPAQPPVLFGNASIIGADRDPDDEDSRQLEVGATSPAELLRDRKLTSLSDAEKTQIHALIARLRSRIATRPSRRYRPADSGMLDVRQTAKAAMAQAGDPARLLWRVRRIRPRKRVLLLDISGSMGPYSGGLLNFGYAAYRCAPRQTELFTMGTRLTRITQFLRSGDAEAAMIAASNAIPDWCGGTRIGDQLKAFLDLWGQRGMARSAIVVIASDGWERGDTGLLATQVQRLSSLAERVIWANPHKSTPGFEPLTRGMQAALPYIDQFVAGSTANEFSQLLDLMAAADPPRHRFSKARALP